MTGTRESSQRSEPDVGSETGREASKPNESRRADAEHMSRLTRARRVRVAKTILPLGIIAGLIVLVSENAGPLPIRLFVTTVHPELIWVLAGFAIFGGIAGYLIARPGKRTKLHRDTSSD